MEIFDSLHGYIEIDNYIKDIIDTFEFQRLRNIKQLGCCYYVFPGASHNRYEHSLGVYYLTRKYIQYLNRGEEYISEYEKKILCISAIIHDIGHGPFSHLFDEIINDNKKHHEYRSIEIFKSMNDKYKFGYNNDDIQFIYRIIKPDNEILDTKKYLFQIVSNKNGIDVDRFDYLMRDIKMIGLNYGIEYDRILRKSKIIKNSDNQFEICYSDKIKTHIEDFYHIRYTMYKEIYNHKTVRIIEYMMKEYLILLNNYKSIQDIIKNDNWNEFILFNDDIMNEVFRLPVEKNIFELYSIIENIYSRKLYEHQGSIITKLMDINDDIIYDNNNNNIIIDKILLKYYSNEECKYYNENKIIKQKMNNKMNNEYIISIYTKDNQYKEEAKKIFNEISKSIE